MRKGMSNINLNYTKFRDAQLRNTESNQEIVNNLIGILFFCIDRVSAQIRYKT